MQRLRQFSCHLPLGFGVGHTEMLVPKRFRVLARFCHAPTELKLELSLLLLVRDRDNARKADRKAGRDLERACMIENGVAALFLLKVL